MIGYLYNKFLEYLYFFKQLYNKCGTEFTSSASYLMFLTTFLNLHSLLIILEFGFNFNIGVGDFWTPTQTPKVGYGYILGLTIAVIFYMLIAFLERRFTRVEKIKIMRTVILKKKKRLYTILYVVSTLIIFIYTIGWMITSIIPEGGL